jgi:tRNA threonylcarbamoyladenosine biosynthesis protein TsaB
VAEQFLSRPSAAPLVQLAHARALREEWVNPWEIQPLYMRLPDAQINWSVRATGSTDNTSEFPR